jgi:hypothetical protein
MAFISIWAIIETIMPATACNVFSVEAQTVAAWFF